MKSRYIVALVFTIIVIFTPINTAANQTSKHIVAIGGGKITNPASPSAIRTYLLNLVPSTGSKPKVCLLPQARLGASDYEQYIKDFTTAFEQEGAEVTCLSLAGSVDEAKIAELLLSQDLIYVGGGNTRTMLAVWREWGIDTLLRKAYEQGIILAGTSAGAICWFEQGITDSTAPLTVLPCLGFIKGSCCPHYDSEPYRQTMYAQALAEERALEGIALCDYTAIHIAQDIASEEYSMRLLTWRSPAEITSQTIEKRKIRILSKDETIELDLEEIN